MAEKSGKVTKTYVDEEHKVENAEESLLDIVSNVHDNSTNTDVEETVTYKTEDKHVGYSVTYIASEGTAVSEGDEIVTFENDS